MNGLPDSSLLVQSLGSCLLVSGAGIAAVGGAYAVAGGVVGRDRSRSRSGVDAFCRLSAPAVPTGLTEAWCRAAGLAVAALGVAAGAPWVHAFVADVVGRWDGSDGGGLPWRYALLALVAWIGFLPFALFVWRLPAWAAGRFPRGPARAVATPRRGADGRPGGARLGDASPYTDPVRRACRRHAGAVALCAPGQRDDPAAGARQRPPLEVVLLIPAVVAFLLATTINAWIVAAAIAVVAAWGGAVYAAAYRAAVASPGTALADYLLLAQDAAGNRADRARRLAEACLDRNPAILQDHEQLLAVLARAIRIGPVPWSPRSVDASQVEVATRLWTTDRRGQDREIAIAFHLRRQPGRDWRITRIALDDPDGRWATASAPHFALASVWTPR